MYKGRTAEVTIYLIALDSYRTDTHLVVAKNYQGDDGKGRIRYGRSITRQKP